MSEEVDSRRLARNAVWNLLSLVAPMAIALAAIPALIRTLGADRFGVLTLAWMRLRHPVFLGLREDKPASEVRWPQTV